MKKLNSSILSMTQLNLGTLTKEQLQYIISHMKSPVYNLHELICHSQHIIKVLSTLSPKYTTKFIQKIDSLYTGLSHHFIIEAKNNFNTDNALFLFRVSYHLSKKSSQSLFVSHRLLLIEKILFNDVITALFKEINEITTSLKLSSFLMDHDKKYMLAIILDKSFIRYQDIVSNNTHASSTIFNYIEEDEEDEDINVFI